MDGLAVAALVREWNAKYRGARIDKVHQPTERTLVLTVRKAGTERLLLSAERGRERAHTVFAARPDNPQDPPMFCMLVRKYVAGGRIRSVRQHEWDRILELVIDTVDEIGDAAVYTLTLELMGKHSNLILCRADNEGRPLRIIDAVVRVPADLSRVRQILPGLDYVRPPAQDRIPAAAATPQALASFANEEITDEKTWAKALMRHVAGIGPASAREVLHRARSRSNLDAPDLPDPRHTVDVLKELAMLAMSGGEPASVGLDELGRAVACAPFRLTAYPRLREVPSFDAALADFAEENKAQQVVTGQKASLMQALSEQLDKLRGKRTRLEAELANAKEHEQLRIQGEVLTAFAHQVEKGLSQVTLENFYENNRPITIALDPAKSATENAQAYFKQASKRKRALTLAREELDQTLADMHYLESCRVQVQDADAEQLSALKDELVEEGFLKADPKRHTNRPEHRHKGQRQTAQRRNGFLPHTFVSRDGWTILVGRSNQQNDRLTLRQSRPDDIWLHVKGQPGSHVIIRRQAEAVPEDTLFEAAMLAAYYSKARDSSHVPVDYTEVRHVWKPNGARPGFVLYEGQRTLFVTPDRSRIRSLLEDTGQPSNNPAAPGRKSSGSSGDAPSGQSQT